MLASLLTSLALLAAPKAPAKKPPVASAPDFVVPERLKPWVPWVLYDQPDAQCPFLQDGDQDKDKREWSCTWPGELQLALAAHGATFHQTWTNFSVRPRRVPLPGDGKHWPLQVTLDGRQVSLVSEGAVPVVLLPPGSHSLAGRFEWSDIAEGLVIPDAVGLLSATRGGKPDVEADWSKGRLWLNGKAAAASSDTDDDATSEEVRAAPVAPEPDRLTVTVSRLIQDDNPPWVTTSIELVVSGKSREALLGPALPEGALATEIKSALPIRLEASGLLRAQLRRGTYAVEIRSHLPGAAAILAAPQPTATWAPEELWAFEPQEQLHHLDVTGAPSVDPTQTRLPDAWKQWRTFRLLPGQALAFEETRRGAPEPSADALSLSRDLWLDLDGRGYSVRDQLSGQIHKGWRLELPMPFQLGDGVVDGRNQLITRIGDTGLPGVELRNPSVSVVADSRLVGPLFRIPAVGWTHEVSHLTLSLHLPPGWRLFHAPGVDTVSGSEAASWALGDLLLALAAVAWVMRLRGWRWGLVAAAALVLTFKEAGAPQWGWLGLLGIESLWQWAKARPVALRAEYLKILRGVRLAIAALIVLTSQGFALQQLRTALDPQLSSPVQTFQSDAEGSFDETRNGDGSGIAQRSLAMFAAKAPAGPRVRAAPSEKRKGMSGGLASADELKAPMAFDAPAPAAAFAAIGAPPPPLTPAAVVPVVFAETIDPDAIVQTGAGLPTWQWSTAVLRWNSKVPADKQVTLWLIPASVERVLSVLRVLLLLALLLGILGAFSGTLRGALRRLGEALRPRRAPGFASVLGLGLALGLLGAGPARADEDPDLLPVDSTLLKELAERLAAQPECSPNCADLQKLTLRATAKRLRLVLEADAVVPTAVPLPGDAEQWRPTLVKLDGSAAIPVRRQDGKLWLRLPAGTHTLELAGPLPQRDTVSISLPLVPHLVRSTVEGWQLEGLDENGVPDGDLQLQRGAAAQPAAPPDADDSSEDAEVDAQAAALASENLPAFSRVTRVVHLGLTWSVDTTVERLTPIGTTFALQIPLLPGERVVTDGLRVVEGKVQLSFAINEQQKTWHSELKQQSPLKLLAREDATWTERWQVDQSPIWHLESKGVPMVSVENGSAAIRPTWSPWPGEALTLDIQKPAPVPGQSFTIDSSAIVTEPGEHETSEHLSLAIRTTRAQPYPLVLPDGIEIKLLTVNGVAQVFAPHEPLVSVDLTPGENRVEIGWTRPVAISALFRTSTVNLGVDNVNPATVALVGKDRWLLWLSGSGSGAVFGPTPLAGLYLGLALLLALVLASLRLAPLRVWEWGLLALGLVPLLLGDFSFWALAPAAFLLALGYRRAHPLARADLFNASQVALGMLGVVSVALLVRVAAQSLSSLPPQLYELPSLSNLPAAANGGVALAWMSDRAGQILPHATIVSVPVWVYRALMLAWLFFLGFGLRRWGPWIVRSLTSSGGLPGKLEDLWRPTTPEPKAPWVPLPPLPPLPSTQAETPKG